MITFSCTNCGRKLNVEDKRSGKRVKCPKCGQTINVPGTSRGQTVECPGCGSYVEASPGGVPAALESDPLSADGAPDEDRFEPPYERAGMDHRLASEAFKNNPDFLVC